MNIQTAKPRADLETALAAMGTGPIPAAPYYKEEYFTVEREAVFRRTWLQVGHVCELPESGSFIVRFLDALNVSMLITRGKDGVIRAFHNVCTHRGTRLVPQISGKASQFSCRYHMWTFGNDGTLRGVPDFEKFDLDKASCNLKPIAVDTCAGLIFINLAKTPAQSLREFLGPLAEQLEKLPVARATTFTEYVYDVEANWKVTFDNFQENYHLRFIHNRSGITGTSKENPFGYPTEYSFYGPHRTKSLYFDPNADIGPVQGLGLMKGTQFAAAEGYGESPLNKEYFALFPNMFLLGTAQSHFSHTVIPVGPLRSRGVIRLYWIGDDDSASKRFAREFAMAAIRDIHCEDRTIVEASQQGLLSGALDHIHFQINEVLCRHLFHAVNSMVDSYKSELRGREAT